MNSNKKQLGIPEGFEVFCKLPLSVTEGGVSFHDCDNGYKMLVLYGAKATDMSDLCIVLEENGFLRVAEREMNGNPFYTFRRGDELSVHTYLIRHSSQLRIIVSEKSELFEAYAYDEICEPLLIPLNADGGMGYVMRAKDGSFLVIDGGYNNENCASQLYEKLKNNAPDPQNVVISCWILTHAHKDHIGTFTAFAKLYENDSTLSVKGIMHNMCTTPEQTRFLDNSYADMARDTIAEYYGELPVYIAQAGQEYDFGGLKTEILYTMQDYMPALIKNEVADESLKKGDRNIQSVVFRVSVNGHSIFFMADTSKVCCDEMCKRYENYLESEYVQMSHHGIGWDGPCARNATEEIYTLISPTYGLLPCNNKHYEEKFDYDINIFLVKLIGGREYILCSAKVHEPIALPYH